MSTTKTAAHTSGPWVAHDGGMDAWVTCPDGRKFLVGDIVYHEENKANARLIAAAPELLAALKAVLVLDAAIDLLAGNETIAAQIRQAIAKAEGTP